jgi:hypothetical protein
VGLDRRGVSDFAILRLEKCCSEDTVHSCANIPKIAVITKKKDYETFDLFFLKWKTTGISVDLATDFHFLFSLPRPPGASRMSRTAARCSRPTMRNQCQNNEITTILYYYFFIKWLWGVPYFHSFFCLALPRAMIYPTPRARVSDARPQRGANVARRRAGSEYVQKILIMDLCRRIWACYGVLCGALEDSFACNCCDCS